MIDVSPSTISLNWYKFSLSIIIRANFVIFKWNNDIIS